MLVGAAGVWCAPGGPYRSLDGALEAIRWARETNVAFLGTCAGFQHGVIEFARNVLGHRDAVHAEYGNADGADLFIDELLCSLVVRGAAPARHGIHRWRARHRLAGSNRGYRPEPTTFVVITVGGLIGQGDGMPEQGAIAELNRILSELIDVVQEVKQARRIVPRAQALRQEVDRLLDDIGAWARELVVQDEALGVSPLASMPTAAGRTPRNLWPGQPGDDEVRQLLEQHLDRLDHHVTAALVAQTDSGSRAVLDDVQAGLTAHRTALADLRP